MAAPEPATAPALDVYLRGRRVGTIERRGPGRYRFAYAAEVVERLGEGSLLLSASLPVGKRAFSPSESRPFFGGLLPEGTVRSTIARSLGLSEDNGYGLLAELGAECAGAVAVVPAGRTPPAASEESFRWLDDTSLARAVADLPRHPLGVSSAGGVRLSLGGVQHKLLLTRGSSGDLGQPLGGAPSTHILKPGQQDYPGLVANEAFCLRVARCARLPVAAAEIIYVAGEPCLLVERFDRGVDQAGEITRVHQEDCCQALGRLPVEKYESEGGPTLAELVALLRDVAGPFTARSITELLDATVLNLLFGNSDAHAKNFALLHEEPGEARLSPLYDLVSTNVFEELAPRLAMSIGGTEDPDDVDLAAFERLAADVGVGRQLPRRARDLADRILGCARAERDAAVAEGWYEPVIDRIVTLCETRRRRLVE